MTTAFTKALLIASVLLPAGVCGAQCVVGSGSYIVMSPTQVAVKCNTVQTVNAGWTASLTSTGVPTLTGTISAIANNAQWLQVDLTAPQQFIAATDYKLSMTINGTVQPDVPVSTTSSYTVAKDYIPSQYATLRFQSNVLVTKNGDCALAITSAYATSHPVALNSCFIRSPLIYGGLQMEAEGEVEASMVSRPPYQVTPDSLTGFVDVFGKTPTIAKSARIPSIKPPASKDVADYYFNLTFLGATGSSPSFTIDGKVVPRIIPGLYGGFELNPLVLAANTGQGTIATAKFTDTIDFGANAARSFEPHNHVLEAWVFTPGFNAETDKAFDTWNALGTIDAKFSFKRLYSPQSRGRLRRLDELLVSSPASKPTLDDVPQFYQKFGYVLEAHTLLETGTKLGDTIVKNSDKSVSMTLPAYSIVRPGVQLHAILQYLRASVDCVTTGRYLVETEQSVLEHKDKSLYLYPFHGGKAYQVVTGAYQVDGVGHWSISVTYDDGFSPPTYKRANSVQIGLLVKY